MMFSDWSNGKSKCCSLIGPATETGVQQSNNRKIQIHEFAAVIIAIILRYCKLLFLQIEDFDSGNVLKGI